MSICLQEHGPTLAEYGEEALFLARSTKVKVGRYLFSLNKIINNKETQSAPDSGPCSRTG